MFPGKHPWQHERCLCLYGNSIRTLKRAFLQNIYGVIQKVCGTGKQSSVGGKGDTIWHGGERVLSKRRCQSLNLFLCLLLLQLIYSFFSYLMSFVPQQTVMKKNPSLLYHLYCQHWKDWTWFFWNGWLINQFCRSPLCQWSLLAHVHLCKNEF